jgi:hypothetical protein
MADLLLQNASPLAASGDRTWQLAVLAIFQQLQIDVLRARLDRTAFPTDAAEQRCYVESAVDHVFGLLKDGFPLTANQRIEITTLLQEMVFGPRRTEALAS